MIGRQMMNKSAIKNFAVRARNKLIEDVTQKAYELGITKDEIKSVETFEGGFKIKGLENSKIYKKYETKQREKLVSKINEKGFEQVIEEVAYTWFNRFIALRFMEVNEYLPTGVRVLSSIEEGKTEPDIIKEALNIDLDIDKDIVYKLIDANDTADLFKYLLIKQCNQLGQIMPMVFEEISDYTELLLPDNLLAEGSVIRDLVESIEEEDYKDQVEIIGWMYQYYISEKKDEVFEGLKNNKKITKENIPAATQLFTPKWIVKYMIENSLGRLWLDSHPDEELKAQWEYYLEEAEQEPEVQKKLDELKNPDLNPEDIKVLDPAMGSGHILVYAFDVLYDIYLKANYSERDIPQLILEKNLYGLDIDDRAGQLAAFALMMKARSKNRRIFRKKIELNVCAIQESNGIPKEAIDYLISPKDTGIVEIIRRVDIEYLLKIFKDAKDYGSLLEVKKIDFYTIEERLDEIKNGGSQDLFEYQYREILLEKLPTLIKQAKTMSEKYDVVCTNPPYMGSKGMNVNLRNYLDVNYKREKTDLFSVFMKVSHEFTKINGYNAMITMQSWMYLKSFYELREDIIKFQQIINLIHIGYNSFPDLNSQVAHAVAFVFRKSSVKYIGKYLNLNNDKVTSDKEEIFFERKESQYYTNIVDEFAKLPEKVFAYWASKQIRGIYNESKKLKNYAEARQGLATSDNNRFLRYWYEVEFSKIGFSITSRESAIESRLKWFPYNKGGQFRKWYGNNEYIINWENDGLEIRNLKDDNGKQKSRPQNLQYMFRESITWSKIAQNKFSVRYQPQGFLFDVSGCSIFTDKETNKKLIALLNTNVIKVLIDGISPTVNYEVGTIENLPVYNLAQYNHDYHEKCIEISRKDWDSYETSWDFCKHPLLEFKFNSDKIENSYKNWVSFTKRQCSNLKEYEQLINKSFAEIYRLQDEVSPEVKDKDITIRKSNKERDIKSFISYAVGCMFGRYSLDQEGMIYGGGQFNINRYKTFIPAKDNVLVIADNDYFEDDIVNRFVEFVRITFEEKTLEENLDYIAETLGNKANETSRQTIRRYFLKDFYNDHIRTYNKRPIYWLFDSGKQNGFQALIYMQRYDASTVARVRTDYLHKLQKKYEAEVKRLDVLIESEVSAREKASAMKKKDSIKKQIAECLTYDQVIAHVANQKIEIDLDDGVAVNYEKFQSVIIPQGEGKKPLKANLLAEI